MKRAAKVQQAEDKQRKSTTAPVPSDPYDHIPPPQHPGHKDKEWKWHPTNAGPLSDLQRLAMYDNPWLRSGYRALGHNSYLQCITSLCYPHNDLLNVYTHLVGSIYFVCEGCFSFVKLGKVQAPIEDRIVFLTYALLVALCFFMSAYYHLMRSHSLRVFRKLLTLDISGIALCIGAADLLVSHFEMRCMPWLRLPYASAVFVLLGLSLFYVPYLVRHRRTNQRTLILMSFAALALGSLLHRLAHAGGIFAVDQATTVRTFLGLLATYAWTFFGLVIRRLKVPERLVPYWFDIVVRIARGASHQLFHVCTIVGCAHLWSVYIPLYEEGAIRYCRHTIGN